MESRSPSWPSSSTLIPAAKTDITSAETAFEMSLAWEQEVTGQINAMMDLAIQEKDYASQAFLQWFVTEQVEEVSTMENMLQVVRKAGEKNLLMMEAYLTHRE
jgi:ferritin